MTNDTKEKLARIQAIIEIHVKPVEMVSSINGMIECLCELAFVDGKLSGGLEMKRISDETFDKLRTTIKGMTT